MKRLLQRVRWLPSLLSALLLILAFPKFFLWPLAWVALIPFYRALATKQTSGGALGFWLGFPLFLGGCYWITELNGSSPADKLFPWVGLALMQGSFFAVFGALAGRVLPKLPTAFRPFAFAAGWVLFEWVRSLGRLNFPWFVLAVSQASGIGIGTLGIVDITGQWGLSFAIALVNGLFAEAWSEKRAARHWAGLRVYILPARLWAGLGVYTLLSGYGLVRFFPYIDSDTPGMTVAAIQAGRSGGDDLLEHVRLTLEVAEKKPDFVVWTEGATGSLLQSSGRKQLIEETARRAKTTIFVGALEEEASGKRTNTVWCVGPDGATQGRYDKQVLVPGGEFYPFYEVLGNIYDRFGVNPSMNDTPGTESGVFRVGKVNVGTLICYESVLPWVARSAVRHGAEVLVLPTSDSSYGATAGPHQHLQIAIVRAVETRRSIVRAAATGISAIIPPDGDVNNRKELLTTGAVVGRVVPRTGETLFVRFGDWFVGICAAIALGAMLYCLRRK